MDVFSTFPSTKTGEKKPCFLEGRRKTRAVQETFLCNANT